MFQFIRDGIPYLNEENKQQLKKDLDEGVLFRATERTSIQFEDEDALKQGNGIKNTAGIEYQGLMSKKNHQLKLLYLCMIPFK